MDTAKQPILLDGVQPGALVAVAMSGGVDSCVAAVLMVEAGYRVVGITLQLYDHGAIVQKKGSCCAGQDIYDARQVADQWKFPHYVLDYESLFKAQVIDDFVDSYLHGETPIPCIRCNQQVKFKDLLTSARDLGAQALVTGHYVQRLQSAPHAELHRAVDHNRDQSYFLFTTTQAQLDYLRFPLGGMSKAETRSHAQRLGLAIAEKPDSQDICFVPSGGYASVIEKFRPGALEAGEIVHIDGRVLGTHEGIINYTVGQRRGLGGGSAEPLFVIRLEPETHRVVVGPHEALAQSTLILKEVNWLTDEHGFAVDTQIQVKFRSTHDPVAASLRTLGNKQAEITFTKPEYGIARGQACVFYDNSRILGGGWIESVG
ncbi:MAG: tRNA 2-thiouridine(34) synthase MnmA [Alphaproteobacteria bacterium]